MTAGEVAGATGLGRASVSTTLSKLARSGEVAKAARGYQLAGQAPARASRRAAKPRDGDAAMGRPAGASTSRRRAAPSETTGAKDEQATQRAGRGRRGRGEELSGDRVAMLLAERREGLSAVALAKQLGVAERRVLAVLRELEAAGRARREGSRRTSRWIAVTDEERIAARAAELEARSTAAGRAGPQG